ncbi:DUF6884 domain-containing protein [Streptosporangium roseum]|uniref:DUF6884 domain-containing protein n=1 Tax=Streptosporangium roseum TaxID=2001 RepID=UPI0033275811
MTTTAPLDLTRAGLDTTTPTQSSLVVIVPCGSRKAETDAPVPAGELYTGSYHRATRRAAETLAGASGRVLILSALHGLVELDQMVAPYELRAGQAGTVDGETLRAQAAALGITDAHTVVLGGRAYVKLAREVWPALAAPLEGTRGIGEQLSRLAAIYKTAPQRPADTDYDAIYQNALQRAATCRAEQAERETRRRAAYVTADTIHVDRHGRASVRFDFPRSTGKAKARAEAARRFAAAYDVQAAQLDAVTLEAHGTPEQVARFASALPRLIELAEGYASLAVRTYGRWERHSSSALYLEGVDEAGRRALTRRFRVEAFDVVVDTLLDPAREIPQADEAAPMWEQADAVASAITEYGWFDVATKADAKEVAHLLETALVETAASSVPAAPSGRRLLTTRPARRTAVLRRGPRSGPQITTRPEPGRNPGPQRPGPMPEFDQLAPCYFWGS